VVPEQKLLAKTILVVDTGTVCGIIHGMHVNTLAELTATASEEKTYSSD